MIRLLLCLFLCAPIWAQTITTVDAGCPRIGVFDPIFADNLLRMTVTKDKGNGTVFTVTNRGSSACCGWMVMGLTDPNILAGLCRLRCSPVWVFPMPGGAGVHSIVLPPKSTFYAQAGWDYKGYLFLGRGFKIATK